MALDKVDTTTHPRLISKTGDIDISLLVSLDFDHLVGELAHAQTINVRQIPENQMVTVIKRIGTRIREDQQNPKEVGDRGWLRNGQAVGAISNILTQYIKDDSLLFPQSAIAEIRGFYGSGEHEADYLERDNIGKLIVLDERNKGIGQSLEVKKQAEIEVLHELTENSGHPGQINVIERRTQAYTLACGKEATREIMYQFIDRTDILPTYFLTIFANTLGFETMRFYINEFVKTHPTQKGKLEDLSRKVGLDQGEAIIFDVGDLYQTVDFTDYGPYKQLQEEDNQFLLSELRGKKRVIDVGFGSGRHMIPLLKAGINVEGIEVTDDTFASIHRQFPHAKVHIGSMQHLPLPDGYADALYAMGRTFTHVKSIPDAVFILREFHRVLGDSGEDKKVLIDLPSVTSEELSENIRRRGAKLMALGIWNTEEGNIHDSPDAKHFIDRLSLTESQLRSIALLGGFNARLVKKVPYIGATGKNAENAYWEFTPRPEGPFTLEEMGMIQLALRPADLRVFGIEPLEHFAPPRGMKLKIEDY